MANEQLQKSIEGTKVSYKQLGKSGLRVSVPILGTMSFGSKEWAPWVEDDEDKVVDLLKEAYDVGLNTWDTADMYSNGRSEELIGIALKKLNIPRHKVTILTKCWALVLETYGGNGNWVPGAKDSKDYINQSGLSRAAIFNAVDASLRRLQTDYIDLFQIHRFDPNVPIEETMKALHDVVQSGKVRYIGASSMWAYQFQSMQNVAEKNGWTKFVSMQNHYSLCYREEEREMNRYCHETGVGLIPWSPLYRGNLARPVNTPETPRFKSMGAVFNDMQEPDIPVIKRVEELAEKKGWKMSHVALAWIIQKGTTPIVGCNSIERMHDAVAVKGKTLTEEEIKFLEELYQTRAVVGHS